MTTKKPEQRAVRCRIFTSAGWIEGALHVPVRVQLIEFLNHSGRIYRLTDVALPGITNRERFFALERSAAIAVVPDDAEELLGARVLGEQQAHRVVWLMASGTVFDGTIDILQGVRVSDHLIHNDDFVVLRDVTIFVRRASSTSVEPGIRAVALQPNSAVGCSEIDGG